MPSYDDSLRGYGFPIFQRDNFICVYCGLDGKEWPNYLYFSQDHLLPEGHPLRDELAYITTACIFCNVLANKKKYDVQGKTPAELIEQKKAVVLQAREKYREFWMQNVQSKETAAEDGIVGSTSHS